MRIEGVERLDGTIHSVSRPYRSEGIHGSGCRYKGDNVYRMQLRNNQPLISKLGENGCSIYRRRGRNPCHQRVRMSWNQQREELYPHQVSQQIIWHKMTITGSSVLSTSTMTGNSIPRTVSNHPEKCVVGAIRIDSHIQLWWLIASMCQVLKYITSELPILQLCVNHHGIVAKGYTVWQTYNSWAVDIGSSIKNYRA